MLKPVRTALCLWVCLALTVCGGAAFSQSAPVKSSVMGSWTLVSETVQREGKTIEPFGAHPVGSMMLDGSGHVMMMISRPDLPHLAANRRDAGTPEENKQVLSGILAFFGKYTVNVADGVLTYRIEASTFPNWIGTDQMRYFTVSGDEMTWTNRAPAVGGESAKLVWKRVE